MALFSQFQDLILGKELCIMDTRVHGLKFQSVTLPNVLIGNIFGPVGEYFICINLLSPTTTTACQFGGKPLIIKLLSIMHAVKWKKISIIMRNLSRLKLNDTL